MPQITTASERMLEICSKATEGVRSWRAVEQATGIKLSRPHSLDDMESLVQSLKQTAERAIKVGGQGHTHVVVEEREIDTLERLRATG